MNKHPSEKFQSILTTKTALMSACCLPLLLAACGGGSDAGHDATSASSAAGAVAATPDPAPAPTGSADSGASPLPGAESSTASAVTTGPVHQAASCAFEAVAAAASQASLGTTVRIPAGDCNWGTQQLSLPAGVHLVGAGRDATIIRREGVVPNTKYLVAFDCRNGRRAEFSGMTLVGNGNGDIEDKGLGLLNGCRDFRVSESRFTRFIFSAVYVGDAPNQRGVIYHNDFVDNYSAKQGNLGYGVVVYGGGGAWPALELGSANAVFVENNWFSGNRHNIASNNGSVYVFRYNTVVGREPAKDYAMTDAHGLTPSSPRGSRSFEIYANHYTAVLDSGLQRTAIGIRGGDGVIYDNFVGANISRPIELSTEGFACGVYPGPDQTRSLYIWNNTPTTNGYATGGIDNNCPDSIGLNRDYFLMRKPGYVPYAYPHPLRSVAP